MQLIGYQIIRLGSVDSTNNYAANLLNTPIGQDGTVILAYEQFAGKGQRGAHWQSNKGENLTFSVILKPLRMPADHAFYLSAFVALAIIDALKEWIDEPCLIKWPNDILVGHKKLAGILIESGQQAGIMTHAICGIGLNVNQMEFDNLAQATSMGQLSRKTFELDQVLTGVLAQLDKYYRKLLSGKATEVKALYEERLFGMKQWRYFLIQDQIIKACVYGVNTDGRLMLELEDGRLETFANKEISWIF